MMNDLLRAFSRRGLAAIFAGFAFLAFAPAAFADKGAEDFVAQRAPVALAALGDPKLTPAGRSARFGQLMDELADLPRISEFVLGRYARPLRADPALRAEWRSVFRDYAIAVYQSQLDQYRGNTIQVLPPSRDQTINGQLNTFVRTQIVAQGRKPFIVEWRLLKTGASYRVIDVAVRLDDNVVWLAIQQQQDFLAILDKNGGNIRALIAEVRRQTDTMRAKVAASNGGRPS